MCIKCMESLSFDIPAETDVVRRFPTSAKVVCLLRPDLEPETSPHDLVIQPPKLHIMNNYRNFDCHRNLGFGGGDGDGSGVSGRG